MSPNAILSAITRKKTVLINAEALRRMLEERELKQWWLARRIAVDRKTVTRWISGQTRRISQENLDRLARELDCSAAELTVEDRLEALGTREDRWSAARQLKDKDVVGMVGPSYSWELAETLIRSAIDSDMPVDLQVALYLKLASLGMYQHKPELTKSSAEIALQRAVDEGDEALEYQSLDMLAFYYLMIGQLSEVVSRYAQVLERRDLIPTQTRLASILCNKGLAHWSIAEFAEALEVFNEAMPIWDSCEVVISTATAWWLRAKLLIELSMVDECLVAVERCEQVSEILNYAKAANMCIAIRAEIASLAGNHDEALVLADRANAVFPQTPNVNPATLESIARVWRRAGRVEQALAEIDRLIASDHEDRLHFGRYRQEKARILMALGRNDEAWQEVETANDIFRELDAPRRMMTVLPREYYDQYRLS